MFLPKESFDEIKKKYSALIMSDSDVVDAFNLVNDVLEAEIEQLKVKAGYATATINRLETAAYEVFSMAGEIESEKFNEHE